MADQSQVTAVAARLLGFGAHRGAAQVLFNAAVQRQSAEMRDRTERTVSGPLPRRRQPAEQPHPANDHGSPS